MTQTIYDAMKSTRNPLASTLFKSVATSDMLFSILPFVPKAGESFSYTREGTLPTFSFVSDAHTSVTEGAGTQTEVTVPKREAVEDIYIRNFADENLSAGNSASQLRMKFKAAGRLLAQKLITGGNITGFTMENFDNGAYIDTLVAGPWIDSNRHGPGSIKYTHSGTLLQFRAPADRTYGAAVAATADGTYTLYSDNPCYWITVTVDITDATQDNERVIVFTSSNNEFDGLAKMMHPAQVLSSSGTNGDTPSLDKLEQLLDAVKVKENLAYLMPAVLRRKYSALFRALGGESTATLPNSELVVPSFNGIPLLTNDWIAANESKGTASTLSSVYLVSLSEEGVYMGALGGASMDVEADPRNASVMGFRFWELGQVQGGPSAKGYRVAWYGGPAMGSYISCARASELITE